MKLPFRQGIVRYQKDNLGSPTFLAKSNGGSSIDLVVSPDPSIIAFAHGTENYLFEEKLTVSEAWTGFVAGTDYWLYWDLDLTTGERLFGSTTVEPVYGSVAPASPVYDQHWFDTANTEMKVWNGVTWITHIRVFACKYDEGAIIQPYPIGSQVNVLVTSYAGFLLYDDDNKPVRKHDRRGRGKFLTTESVFTSQSTQSVNLVFETITQVATATENIPEYSLVYLSEYDEMRLASYLDVAHSVAGLVQEDFFMGEMGAYTTSGYVSNVAWNWNVPPQTPLFCGTTGELTVDVPQDGSIQQVGVVISPQRIFIDIQPQIILINA